MRRLGAVATAMLAAVGGCAGTRVVDGVFHSPKGYTVALPAAGWQIAAGGPADLELRHARAGAGILAHAACATGARPSLDVLTRHLLAGLRERSVLERAEATVAGRPALRTLLEGRWARGGERVRVEAFVTRDARCVYDLLYVAPPAAFAGGRADFARLVESFATE